MKYRLKEGATFAKKEICKPYPKFNDEFGTIEWWVYNRNSDEHYMLGREPFFNKEKFIEEVKPREEVIGGIY